nr:LOW QUALITY PROTEIN: open rectifier potassium channel protein 1-like [Cherax quadricarinatus]
MTGKPCSVACFRGSSAMLPEDGMVSVYCQRRGDTATITVTDCRRETLFLLPGGDPLTGMLLAWTSEFFEGQLFKLFKSKLDVQKQQSRGVIALATSIYIAIGFVVFIFIPGAVFMALEQWSYIEGIYFAYITLTTIGFGDFVTGRHFEGGTLYVYQICVILWTLIGLGYWVMVANFITKALKSKRLQTSVMRSAEEMRKIMQQMGIKQHDPTFLRQHSKATLNLILQVSWE